MPRDYDSPTDAKRPTARSVPAAQGAETPAQGNLTPDPSAANPAGAPAGDSADLPDLAVDIQGLVKTYRGSGKSGPKTALHGVDLQIPRGGLFGLLGPNGAGKSTLINIMAGLVNKTGGTVRLWGHDIDTHTRQARAAIGVVPQELNMDPFFTPREMLDIQAGLYGVPKAERITMELLDAVGLADRADSYARSLSGGMRRRLMVAKAMVHSPPILVLDEPTAGVDIELQAVSSGAMSASSTRRGTTVLLTTHYLEEAEELCDRDRDHPQRPAWWPDDTTPEPAEAGSTARRWRSRSLTEPIEAVPEPRWSELPGGAARAAIGRLVLRYRAEPERGCSDILNIMNDKAELTDHSTSDDGGNGPGGHLPPADLPERGGCGPGQGGGVVTPRMAEPAGRVTDRAAP